jgi:hypothetical protein
VDLLFASSGIEPEIVAGAEAIDAVPGFTGSSRNADSIEAATSSHCSTQP